MSEKVVRGVIVKRLIESAPEPIPLVLQEFDAGERVVVIAEAEYERLKVLESPLDKPYYCEEHHRYVEKGVCPDCAYEDPESCEPIGG